MAFSAGMYFENGAGNIVFAEHPNAMLNAQRGNYVTNTAGNGGAVTANGTSDLTTTTADIDIADVDTFNNSTINSLTGITSIDLSEAYDDLAAGQSLYVLIYVKSNGVISNPTDAGGNEGVGTPATTGQQLPPAIPENSVPLALITLTNGDTTVDAADIEDYRIEGPQGGYFNGTFRVVESGIIAFDINESTGHVGIGSASNSNYGVFIDAPAEQIGANQSFDRVRIDDQGAITVQTATTSTLVTTLHLEEPNIILTGTGAVTRAATFYIANAPTEGDTNFALLIDSGLSEIQDLDMYAPNQVRIYDPDDSNALLFDFDTTNRTQDIFNSADLGETRHWGNFGLGLSALQSWNSNITALEFEHGAISSRSDTNVFDMRYNFYTDGTGDKAMTTGFAAAISYDVDVGDIRFFTDPTSNSADAAVSLVQTFTILANGNVDMNSKHITGITDITAAASVDLTHTTTGAADHHIFTNSNVGTQNTVVRIINPSTTSGGGSDLRISTSGTTDVIQKDTSSKRYKSNEKPIPYDVELLYDLPTYQFTYEDGNEYIGLFAEDVADRFPLVAVWWAPTDRDGNPTEEPYIDNYNLKGLVSIIIEVLKLQHNEDIELEKRVKKLENQVFN